MICAIALLLPPPSVPFLADSVGGKGAAAREFHTCLRFFLRRFKSARLQVTRRSSTTNTLFQLLIHVDSYTDMLLLFLGSCHTNQGTQTVVATVRRLAMVLFVKKIECV